MNSNDEKQIEAAVSDFWKRHKVPILIVISLLAMLLLGAHSFAGTGQAALSWTQPTLGTDGKAVGTLIGNRVYRGKKADGSDLIMLKAFGAPASSYTDTGLDFGTFCYAVTASNSLGESAKSAVACKTLVDPNATTTPPAAPVLKTVTLTAYTIGTIEGHPAMVAAGTVPLGTPCEQSIAIATLYLIPKAAVTPTRAAAWYFAKCATS